jgi:hypothetical protein
MQIFLFFLAVLRFELRAKKQFYHLSYSSSVFCSGYFGDGVLMMYLLTLALKLDPPDLGLHPSN